MREVPVSMAPVERSEVAAQTGSRPETEHEARGAVIVELTRMARAA